MYSQITTEAESKAVMALKRNSNEPWHPWLYNFAAWFKIAQENDLKSFVVNFAFHLNQCTCWHCLELRKRPIVTAQDYYYRLLLLCNGEISSQLN